MRVLLLWYCSQRRPKFCPETGGVFLGQIVNLYGWKFWFGSTIYTRDIISNTKIRMSFVSEDVLFLKFFLSF